MKIAVMVVASLFFVQLGFASPPFTGIVANASFTGLTSDLGNQTLHTPDADGVFRVTVCEDNSGHTGGTGDNVLWTDVYSSSQTHGTSFNGPNPVCDEVSFRAKSGTNIQVNVGGITGLGSPVNVYVTVERLQ